MDITHKYSAGPSSALTQALSYAETCLALYNINPESTLNVLFLGICKLIYCDTTAQSHGKSHTSIQKKF